MPELPYRNSGLSAVLLLLPVLSGCNYSDHQRPQEPISYAWRDGGDIAVLLVSMQVCNGMSRADVFDLTGEPHSVRVSRESCHYRVLKEEWSWKWTPPGGLLSPGAYVVTLVFGPDEVMLDSMAIPIAHWWDSNIAQPNRFPVKRVEDVR